MHVQINIKTVRATCSDCICCSNRRIKKKSKDLKKKNLSTVGFEPRVFCLVGKRCNHSAKSCSWMFSVLAYHTRDQGSNPELDVIFFTYFC